MHIYITSSIYSGSLNAKFFLCTLLQRMGMWRYSSTLWVVRFKPRLLWSQGKSYLISTGQEGWLPQEAGLTFRAKISISRRYRASKPDSSVTQTAGTTVHPLVCFNPLFGCITISNGHYHVPSRERHYSKASRQQHILPGCLSVFTTASNWIQK